MSTTGYSLNTDCHLVSAHGMLKTMVLTRESIREGFRRKDVLLAVPSKAVTAAEQSRAQNMVIRRNIHPA